MQDFCTEICQLGSFLEIQLSHGFGLVNYTGIVVVHTVNVGPYLYLLHTEGCSYERCGIVAASALQVVNLSVGISADEALSDVNLVAFVFCHQGNEFLFDILWVGFGVLVGTHEVKCRQQHCLYALFLQIVHHHVGRDNLALSHDALFFKAGEEIFRECAEVVELVFEKLTGLLFILVGGIELVKITQIFPFKVVYHLIGSFRVLLIEIVRDFQ